MPNDIESTGFKSNSEKKGNLIDAATLDSTGLCLLSRSQIDKERELWEMIIEQTGIIEKQKAENRQYRDQIKRYNDHKMNQTAFEIGSIVFSSVGTGIIVASFQNIQSFNFLLGCFLTILALVFYILSKRYPSPLREMPL